MSTSKKGPPLRWRKKPRPSGHLGMIVPQAFELRRGGVTVATATAVRGGGWYWVARADEIGVPLANTCNAPVATAEEAKAAAEAYVRQHLAGA